MGKHYSQRDNLITIMKEISKKTHNMANVSNERLSKIRWNTISKCF